jgi:5-amino-6-(5-phosphoribosylamino)uracil reductase
LADFESYCDRKIRAAVEARLSAFETLRDASGLVGVEEIGNEWTRALFDGPFYVSACPSSDPRQGRAPMIARINLVFVQSRGGNTEAENPSHLGGGDTDKHLIYEGLSRVDADAVMAGAATAREDELVFSVWHPQLVRLREQCGRPRHPVQVVVSERADLPFDTALLYTTPSLRTIVLTTTRRAAVLTPMLQDRPWIEIIDTGEPLSILSGVRELAARGIRRISAVGGRRTATSLLEAGLISDLYLTTSPIEAGTPGTPFYEGAPLRLELVVEKQGSGEEAGVKFQHFLVRQD